METKNLPIPPKIHFGARVFNWLLTGSVLVFLFYLMSGDESASKIPKVKQEEDSRSALLLQATAAPYATFDDLSRFDGRGVDVWHEKEGVVEIGGAYLRLEPDVYRALRFVATSGSLTVDSVAIYERVRRLRALREEFGKK